LIKPQDTGSALAVPENIPEGITESDEAIFSCITDFELTAEQQERITNPQAAYSRVKSLLAVHWHPEFVPMDLIERRISAMFPNVEDSLIIPTQHNVLMYRNEFAGVEVDCYSRGFNQKVQLLLHFKKERLAGADVLKSMLEHTFKYRSSQLFEYIRAITRPNEEWIGSAAESTGADAALVEFVMKASKLSHHQRMKREDLVCCLEDLTESIRTGKIVIERNGQFVSLTPPDTVSVELQAKMKKDKGELSIEISWKKPLEEPVSAPLIISSDEPEILLTDAMEEAGLDDQEDHDNDAAGDDDDDDDDDETDIPK